MQLLLRTLQQYLSLEAYVLLREQKRLNFIGNVEGKDIPFNVCDVLVTDGFVGNVLLKFAEGMGKFMMHTLKEVFMSNLVVYLSAATLKGQIKSLKKQFDASEHGGAPLLGISKPVIKAHGNSDANAIMNAIFQAMTFVSTGINEEITRFAQDQDALRHHSPEAEMERLYEDSEPKETETPAASAEQKAEDPKKKKKGFFKRNDKK